MIRVHSRLALVSILCAFIALPAFAVGKQWTNGTTDGLWMTAGNWSPSGVPASTDDVTIGTQAGGTNTNVVTLTTTQIQTVNTLTIVGGNGTTSLTITGCCVSTALNVTGLVTVGNGTTLKIQAPGTPSLTALNGASIGGAVVLSSGTFAVAGNADFAATSSLNWTAGILEGTTGTRGTFNFAAGSVVTISPASGGSGVCSLWDGTINNSTTMDYTPSGANTLALQVQNRSALFNNLAGSIFDIHSDGSIDVSLAGTPLFTNNAIVRKTGGAGTFSFGAPYAQSSTGSLLANSGKLSMNGGPNGIANSTIDGTISVAANSTLEFIKPNTSVTTWVVPSTATLTSSGTVAISNGTTTISKDFSTSILTVGGTSVSTFLTGNNISVADALNFTGNAAVSGIGTISVGASAVSTWTSSVVLTQKAIQNSGTITWTSSGSDLSLASGATLTNMSGATFNIVNNTNTSISGAGTVSNAGTINRSGASSTFVGASLNNSGTVNVQAGTMQLNSTSNTSTGSFTVASGATLDVHSGTSNFNAGTVTGLGTMLLSSGTLSVGGTFGVDTLNMTGGTLTGTGTLNVSKAFTATCCTMSGAGSRVIANSATMTINGGMTITQSSITNNGTVTWSAGGLDMGQSASINNNGLFDITSDQGITIFSGAPAPAWVNNANGTFRKSAGSGTSSIGVGAFTNNGTVLVQSGTLQFNTFTASGPTAIETVSSGATLRATGGMTVGGGVLRGTGTVLGNVTNSSGQVAPGLSAGTLTISGNYTQTANGTLAIEIGGMTAGTQYDQLVVTGTATLGGTLALSVINGFAPAIGNTFAVMTFASGSGNFSTLTGGNLGGKALQATVNPSNVTVACVQGVAARADFNGDGKSDVIWRNSVSGDNAIWLMNGVNLLSPALLPSVSDTNWKMAGVGDFDADGKADVLWLNQATGQVVMWLMNGTSVQSATSITTVSDTNWRIAGVGDVNGDGKTDVFWQNLASGDTVVWLMNGSSISSASFLTTLADTNWRMVGVGDLNGDGKADVFWHNNATGQNAVWLMNGASIGSAALVNTVSDTNYKVVGIGDADGDGKADVFWWNQATGDTIVWLMNGFTITSGAFITTVADVNWHVEAVGDFDGDGKADLIWRKVTTGEVVVWLMNGTTLKQASFVTQVSDLNWAIVAPR